MPNHAASVSNVRNLLSTQNPPSPLVTSLVVVVGHDIVIYNKKYMYLVFIPVSGPELLKPLEFPKL